MDGALGAYITKAIEAKVGLIAFPKKWPLGFHEITSATHPIRNVDDLANFKIRVSPSVMVIDTFKTLGASPIATNLAKCTRDCRRTWWTAKKRRTQQLNWHATMRYKNTSASRTMSGRLLANCESRRLERATAGCSGGRPTQCREVRRPTAPRLRYPRCIPRRQTQAARSDL